MERKVFLQTVSTLATAAAAGPLVSFRPGNLSGRFTGNSNRFKISLNAYSFNNPLINKKTSIEELMDFCVQTGFEAIDITGYYMPGYPEPPSDEYLYRLKNKAHRLGLAISGTGIRNEFAEPDKIKRDTEIVFVKKWIDAAAKLGAPVLRIFTGKTIPAGFTREETEALVINCIKQSVSYAKEKGVILAMQNHNDFIKTADQAISILQKVNSEWFGLVLDTGSFVTEEPYKEIAKTTSWAVNWQIKEKLNYQGSILDMDLDKLCNIIAHSGYRGYLPIETLSPGDPFQIVPPFFRKVKTALNNAIQNY